MIKESRQINKIFRQIYESEKIGLKKTLSFRKMMSSNQSRLEYLNILFQSIEAETLNKECAEVLKQNIKFINDFMNGKYSAEFPVPKEYYEDKDQCLIIPTEAEIDFLISLIEANIEMFNLLYRDKEFKLELPMDTFNQNMTRILEIKEHNLAHLLGLTDSEPQPDPNKNQLKKYFLENIEDTEQYGDKISERLLNWIISEEGKGELKAIIAITNAFVALDKCKYPKTYDKDGRIKPKSFEKFKQRYKEMVGLDYPIIKFSRFFTKCINTLNFLNMNNVNQMILDYNAPIGRTDEKDIFIVNSPDENLYQDITLYATIKSEIIETLKKYAKAKNPEEKRRYLLHLESLGVDIKDKDIASYINMCETSDFIDNKGIQFNLSVFNEKIDTLISTRLKNNVHLLGFGTEFTELTPVSEKTENNSHCDTSISLTAAELVGDYYKRGRPFFIDKVVGENDNEPLRISTPIEEIKYLEYLEKLGYPVSKDLEELKESFFKFTEYIKKLDDYETGIRPKGK